MSLSNASRYLITCVINARLNNEQTQLEESGLLIRIFLREFFLSIEEYCEVAKVNFLKPMLAHF